MYTHNHASSKKSARTENKRKNASFTLQNTGAAPSERIQDSTANAWSVADQGMDSTGADSALPQTPASPGLGQASFSVPCRKIRIALRQNVRKAAFSSTGQIDFLSTGAPPRSARGSFTCSCSPNGKFSFDVPGMGAREYASPCTLHSNNDFNIIAFDGIAYRGSMIAAHEGNGRFSVINLCDVEDYLRGVVPLEIGVCGGQGAEAIKAQAIAARTYTYKKMSERQKMPFDVFPTIADQVYGGVGAEKATCNQAILDCRDLVAVYKDSLIYAYYHSTCGGKTANVEDVWDKVTQPYLRSINDCDAGGAPFCRASPNLTWEETWRMTTLSDIIGRFSRETFPQNPASGKLTALSVESRFSCGRVQTLKIETSSGTYRYGGDKIRFVVRRGAKGNSILRSAVITGVKQSGNTLRLSGRGYGHGVGMCQFGAIGRALAGQGCEQIIKAYYPGVEIRGVVLDGH